VLRVQDGFLVADDGGQTRRVPVGSAVTVGRAGHCSLIIRDSAASRQHLEVVREGDAFICRDLGSRNGTLVNDQPVDCSELRHGDRIRVGETVLRFELGEDGESAVPERTVLLQTVLDPNGQVQELPKAKSSKDFLDAAYSLMNSMASTFDPCLLVDTILHTTMKAIRAQRGAVLFAGPDEELLPCESCGRVHTIRDGRPQTARVEDIDISETVAKRVLRYGENVLFSSALSDARIEPTHSMAALNLTSILCVPIRTQNRISGILYIDSNLADHEYTQEDALLAAAAGNSAGLALENSRNHRALLDKQRMEQDIEAAWTIQEGFLVNAWQSDDRRFEVYGTTRPARIVGGDFYDFVRIDEDRVGMLIGDVSGKGVPAALTMAQLLAEFRLCTPGAGSPSEVLARLNERLAARSRRGLFCTVAAVAINLETGHALGASAGHNPSIRVSGDATTTRILEASGPPIGVLETATWSDEEFFVHPGDMLLLYTDGIVEAKAGVTVGGEGPPAEYGVGNLLEIVRVHSTDGPQTLVQAVIEDVDRFCSPAAAHDDCTLIALRYCGHG
jgi:serine phosphatase RsbU (regulator of sigma subunit)/pSer/pThr/pTyr-binding forkhead associated (FHA) protein